MIDNLFIALIAICLLVLIYKLLFRWKKLEVIVASNDSIVIETCAGENCDKVGTFSPSLILNDKGKTVERIGLVLGIAVCKDCKKEVTLNNAISCLERGTGSNDGWLDLKNLFESERDGIFDKDSTALYWVDLKETGAIELGEEVELEEKLK